MIHSLQLSAAVVLLLSLLSSARADDPSAQTDRESQEANALTQAVFKKMECATAGDQSQPLKPIKTSMLRWSNPVVGRVYGNVFLWTESTGRPAAIVSIYKVYAPWNSLDVECSSVSNVPLRVTYGNQLIWSPPPANVKWLRFPSAPSPASATQTRLVQMRALVRRFDARVDDSRLDDKSQVNRELRPLAQPIYRYASPEAGIIDAGMFVFAVGTDPEAVLLLECRTDPQGGKAWYYALARMNRDGLEVRLDEETVWRAGYLSTAQMGNPNSSYRSAPVPQSEQRIEPEQE